MSAAITGAATTADIVTTELPMLWLRDRISVAAPHGRGTIAGSVVLTHQDFLRRLRCA